MATGFGHKADTCRSKCQCASAAMPMASDFGDSEIGQVEVKCDCRLDASWFPPLELPTSTNFEWQWASTVRLTPTAYDADWGATLLTRTRISKVESR